MLKITMDYLFETQQIINSVNIFMICKTISRFHYQFKVQYQWDYHKKVIVQDESNECNQTIRRASDILKNVMNKRLHAKISY